MTLLNIYGAGEYTHIFNYLYIKMFSIVSYITQSQK